MKRVFVNKFIAIFVAVFSICVVSCKKDNVTNLSSKFNSPVYQNHSEYEYALFYSQIYEIVESLSEDSYLTDIVLADSLYTDININNLLYNGTLFALSETSSVEDLNSVIYDMFGVNLEDMSSTSENFESVISNISLDSYLEVSDIYELVVENDLNESDIVLLYTMCAMNNHIYENNKTCIITLNDAYDWRMEVYTNNEYSGLPYSNEFVIWNIHVDHAYNYDRSEIPQLLISGIFTIDSTHYDTMYHMQEYLSNLSGEQTTLAECYTVWLNACDEAQEKYYDDVIYILYSSMSTDVKNKLLVFVKTQYEQKIANANNELNICKASAITVN